MNILGRAQEEARLRYFNATVAEVREIDPDGSRWGFDGGAFLSGARGVGPILAETTCRYLLPVTFPDVLLVSATAQAPSPITAAVASAAAPGVLQAPAQSQDGAKQPPPPAPASAPPSGFNLHHEVWSLKHGRVVARGHGAVVTVDYGTGGERAGVPAAVAAAMASLERRRDCSHLLPGLEAEAARGCFDEG